MYFGWIAVQDSISLEERNSVEYDFETLRNIRPLEIETSSTVRESLRSWNMTVQWWLVAHVYKNIHFTSKLTKNTVLMVVSAYWHGVHPGWYATFLSAPFLLLAEDCMQRGIRNRLGSRAQAIYDKCTCFLTMRYFDYFAVGAFFLSYHEIMRFWSYLYFYGHISLVGIIIIGQTLCWFPVTDNSKLTWYLILNFYCFTLN